MGEWTQLGEALALCVRIILRLAEGRTNVEVARHYRLHIRTVSKWRERFRQRALNGLLNEPRPGQPRKITDVQAEGVITRTLEGHPPMPPRPPAKFR